MFLAFNFILIQGFVNFKLILFISYDILSFFLVFSMFFNLLSSISVQFV